MNIAPNDGWVNSADALSGNFAINWASNITYSAFESVLSVNNSLGDDAPGGVIMLSGTDMMEKKLV